MRLIEDTVKKEATGWDFFDRIYCISLEERADRRQVRCDFVCQSGTYRKS